MIIERRNRLKATSLNNFGYWTAPPYLRYAQFLGWIIPSREVEAFLHAATGRKNVVLHPPPPVRVGEARQLITPSFLSEVATKCHHLPSLVTQSRNLLVLPFLPYTSLVYHSRRSTSFNQRQSNIHLIFPLTLINIISVSDPVSRARTSSCRSGERDSRRGEGEEKQADEFVATTFRLDLGQLFLRSLMYREEEGGLCKRKHG